MYTGVFSQVVMLEGGQGPRRVLTVEAQDTIILGMDTTTLLDHWKLSLGAENKRTRTIETYASAVEQLIAYLDQQRLSRSPEAIDRTVLRGFLTQMLAKTSPATVKQRHSSLSQFFRWLVDEEVIAENPMATIRAPKVVPKDIRLISEAQFDAMVKGCDDTFEGRRDRAILMLLWDTGLRLSEITNLEVDDVNLFEKLCFVKVTKGGGSRTALFTDTTQHALSRYQIARAKHPSAAEAGLWLGKQGVLQDRGISQMIGRRSEALGFHAHPHQFRHSFADRWLSKGGSEGDLIRVVGWSNGSRSMLDRYGKAGQERRANDAYRRLIG